ncbi:MAG: cytochrome c3 family protein [Fidelibacterota bacterium]
MSHRYSLPAMAGIVLLAALTVARPRVMISPGDVIADHGKVASDCLACHTPFRGSTAGKCQACHPVADIGRNPASDRGKQNLAFHQALVEDNCVACHSDHQGVSAFRPRSTFSHALLQADLRQRCEDCHARSDDDVHLVMKGNCSLCHEQEAWRPATFDHDRYFRFDRDHQTTCITCHIENDYQTFTCYGCHEHTPRNIRGEHIEEGIYTYDDCAQCHRSADEDEAKRRWRSQSGTGYDGPADHSDHGDDHD